MSTTAPSPPPTPPAAAASPPPSRAPSPTRPPTPKYSESGTEADDELTGRRRARRKRHGSSADPTQRRIRGHSARTLLRRGIEILLVLIQTIVVLRGQHGRVWQEVLSRRHELLCWATVYVLALAAALRRPPPRPLDPAPLLYPPLLPLLVALTLTPPHTPNPYLRTNLVLSLTLLPPTLRAPWPLLLLPADDTCTFLPPLADALSQTLTRALHPSLRAPELRLLVAALLNLHYHARTPLAHLLRLTLWLSLPLLAPAPPLLPALLLLPTAPVRAFLELAGSLLQTPSRLRIPALWLLQLLFALPGISALAPRLPRDARRKLFHVLTQPLFVLAGRAEPGVTHAALSAAVGVFVAGEVVRGRGGRVGRAVARYLAPFVDARDARGVVVSHFFLLVGVGCGWWLEGVGVEGWGEGPSEGLGLVCGAVCVGLGDAAASLVGRRWGRWKWGWGGGKSVQGSAAYVVAVVAGLGAAAWLQGSVGGWEWWGKVLAVAVWASALEAVSSGVNDNVLVPVGAWVMVKGLGL